MKLNSARTVAGPSVKGLVRVVAPWAPSRRPLVARASQTQEQTRAETKPDALLDRKKSFMLASERLETLLQDACLGNKDTVLVDHLDALSPEERLTLFTNLGTLALLAEILLCWLFGEADPLGGMDFNRASLHAALLGTAYAVPLLLCSTAARSGLFKQSFPVLDQLHAQQADLQKHFVTGMNVTQTGIWLSFVIVPSMLLLLPASKSFVVWSFSFMQQALLHSWGSVQLPTLHLGPLGSLLAPLLSCYMAGMAAASCFGVRPKQIEVLRDALRNADAYFRLAAARQPDSLASTTTTASSSGKVSVPPVQTGPPIMFASSSSLTLDADLSESDEAGRSDGWQGVDADDDAESASSTGAAAADAFRTLAMVWLVSRRRVARLACALTGMNVMYFSVLWMATGDTTTPVVAALLHTALECWYGEQEARKQSGRSNWG